MNKKNNIISETKKTKTYNNNINDKITKVHNTLHSHHLDYQRKF